MYKFKGWDFSELAEYWDLDYDKDYVDADELCKKVIIDCLETELGLLMMEAKKESIIASDLRRFIRKLVSGAGYYAPIWRGYCRVTSDVVLIQMTIPVLGHIWT